MPTSCRTHDYDGELREKWFQMRPMLIERYLPHCRSFDQTLKEIEQWLDRKYFNVKRIGRARRALSILTSHRRGNFDSRNDIDVEELLPILWNQVKEKADLHDTFYEQLCDITGGSCSQGRSTRLFQFLFLFDLPKTDEQDESEKKSAPVTTTDVISPSNEQQQQQQEIQAIVPEQEVVSISVEATPENEEPQQPSITEQTNEESRMSTQENTEEEVQESQTEQIAPSSNE